MFWHIFYVVVIAFEITNAFIYFINEHRSKKIIEDILKNDKNKQYIIKILSSNRSDLHKTNVLRHHFNLNLDKVTKIYTYYKHHKF